LLTKRPLKQAWDLPFLGIADYLSNQLDQDGRLIATLEAKLSPKVSKLAELPAAKSQSAATEPQVLRCSLESKAATKATLNASATGDASKDAAESADTANANAADSKRPQLPERTQCSKRAKRPQLPERTDPT
jgi:hypothetical protein